MPRPASNTVFSALRTDAALVATNTLITIVTIFTSAGATPRTSAGATLGLVPVQRRGIQIANRVAKFNLNGLRAFASQLRADSKTISVFHAARIDRSEPTWSSGDEIRAQKFTKADEDRVSDSVAHDQLCECLRELLFDYCWLG